MEPAARTKHNRAINAAVDALDNAPMPTICVINGLAMGGGCEIAVHCARRVAAMESYMGFVEVGVGLIPGGGGLAYTARRAAEMAAAGGASSLKRGRSRRGGRSPQRSPRSPPGRSDFSLERSMMAEGPSSSASTRTVM